MNGALLAVNAVSKLFGGFVALADVSLTVRSGERLGIIGPNGSGKSTLINCIGGSLGTDSGSIWLSGADVTLLPAHRRARLGIARTFQVPRPFASMTLAENIAVPLEYVTHRKSLHRSDVAAQAHAILAQIGLGGRADASPASLTQVDLRKLELARALASRPRLLILDEVMAGLSAIEVDEMLAILLALNREGIAIVMIEHIMRAIMRFSERVICLDAGRILAHGAPAQIVEDRDVQRIYLGD